MNASDAYREGRLVEAIQSQIQEVKANPTDAGRRMFLFELLVFAGEWDRARRQVEAVRGEDPGQEIVVATYRQLLEAEQLRRKWFEKGGMPKFLAEPPSHVRLRLEAMVDIREGRLADSARRLDEANLEAPSITGELNGNSFEGLRDADDLFGTVLEILARGEYYWIPLEHVDSLAMNAPTVPRDLIWIPARIEVQGELGEVYLSALYPGTSVASDEAIKLGRATDWSMTEEGPVLGVGSRQFLVGERDINIYEWREFRSGS